MNRKEIIEVLNKLDLPKSEYVVLSGASMVMQKVKSKTSDIDISVSKELFGILKNNATIVNSFLGYDVYKVNDYEVEFSNNYSFFDKSNAVLINDIYFQDLNSIKKMKESFNRDKDKKDIKKIDLFLDLKDNLKYEKELYNKGYSLIAGVDEVGRGPLVGPVVAAAVILPKNYKLEGLTDSKKLTEAKRNYFDEIIKRDAISYGIGVIDNDIIDEVNIYEATKLAMKQAISNLKVKPDYVLTDRYGEVYIESKYLYRMENTFLEVCLDKQYVRLFNGTDVICLTPTVTGMEGTPTNEGYFYIYSKEECAILKGEDYESYVDYWMPFDGGIGLHDASWRSEFGSDIYLYNGSHGCVNLPYDAAKIIYENTDVGTPVLVHR